MTPIAHLYVHVPFCRRRCTYCDFAISVRKQVTGASFVDSIRREMTLRPEVGDATWALETMYLGGGTPSLLPPAVLRDLIGQLLGGKGALTELTLEANPEDVSTDAIRDWIGAGVTRVSLGVQSLSPGTLEWMHRAHTAADTVAALRRLKTSGIRDLSVDIIFGLPDFLDADPIRDVHRVLAVEPDHVSVYGLTVEPGTALFKWRARGRPAEADESRYAEEFLRIHEILEGNGYEHYEVSNYAKVGRRSRHNSGYWIGSSYLGLGPSAHSLIATERSWNIRDWVRYRQALDEGRTPVAGREVLTSDERHLERLFLGLRTVEGISLESAGPLCAQTVSRAQAAGWLESRPDRLVATPEGWLRLDEMLVALTTSGDGG
jgi:putative oxygen-independent coproporphyrinogen III oxidase